MLAAAAALAALLALAAQPGPTLVAQAAEAPGAGCYLASQPEIAAALQLLDNGRFRYSLSYGALDETAQGTWRSEGEAVVLSGDPVEAPSFLLLEDRPLAEPRLVIDLDLPKGMSRQYFEAVLELADGRTESRQFAEDGLDLDLEAIGRPVSVRIALPMFDVASQPFALASGRGHALRVSFSPNDLGKVAFADVPLDRSGGALVLRRHQREIALKPVSCTD